MIYQEIAPIPKRMTIAVGLCVVGLMAFGLALSYYKNILFDRQLLEMQQRNARLHTEVLHGYAELSYLQSSQYKDKYAKEYFNLLRPNEKVLFVHQPDTPVIFGSSDDITAEEKEAVYEENLRNIRIIDHWKLYLFHHDQIDDLRKTM